MNHFFDTLRTRVNQHMRYQRTVQELRNLPIDVALDLDLNKADAKTIAFKAVYGR